MAPAKPSRRAFRILRLGLSEFRSYSGFAFEPGAGPLVITGDNGSGKTNLLEAVSLLAPGRGLRRAALPEFFRSGSVLPWAVSARVDGDAGTFDVGTGVTSDAPHRRAVRVDGTSRSSAGVLGDIIEIVWVTPAMDGLFTGPAAERRRFLDRLILCFDPHLAQQSSRFERAMMSRNRLLALGVREASQIEGLENVMAEAGVAIAAARVELAAALGAVIDARRAREPDSPFPWATVAVAGQLEEALTRAPAIDIEAMYADRLRQGRERDRASGRTFDGPHRSDLGVMHGPKAAAASACSTGEQKALLIGLVLAHAELISQRRSGHAPILLFDEAAAHLDAARRGALFKEIQTLGAQAWMTGTDPESFSALSGAAEFWVVQAGRLERSPAP